MSDATSVLFGLEDEFTVRGDHLEAGCRRCMLGGRMTCSSSSPSCAAQYEGLDFTVAQTLIAGAVDLMVFLAKYRRLGGTRPVRHCLSGEDGACAARRRSPAEPALTE
jgi:hypothetical protein